MRGEIDSQIGLLTLTTPEKRVPAEHPIREIKQLADTALRGLEGAVADRVRLDPIGTAVLRPRTPVTGAAQ